MSEEDKAKDGCFRVFCTLEKKLIAERVKQTVASEATENERMMCEEGNKDIEEVTLKTIG